MRLPLVCLFVFALLFGPARAAEPFFKKDDVIALVGGEDMVVAAEDGYLELLLVRALPDYHLRFRSLAWEGDTVFEQNRELNFPSLEDSLDKVGATVVICQFGQMESLAGKEKIPEFITAYEKLLERFSGGGKRRVVIFSPTLFLPDSVHRDSEVSYLSAVEAMASKHGIPFFPLIWLHQSSEYPIKALMRDGIHYNAEGQYETALHINQLFVGEQVSQPLEKDLCDAKGSLIEVQPNSGAVAAPKLEQLRQLINAKNLLWFNYWRVQNWAFLAGDRTNQPSSRDWRDPSKRWFPAEREEFIPLIEAREKEIDAFAEKLK